MADDDENLLQEAEPGAGVATLPVTTAPVTTVTTAIPTVAGDTVTCTGTLPKVAPQGRLATSSIAPTSTTNTLNTVPTPALLNTAPNPALDDTVLATDSQEMQFMKQSHSSLAARQLAQDANIASMLNTMLSIQQAMANKETPSLSPLSPLDNFRASTLSNQQVDPRPPSLTSSLLQPRHSSTLNLQPNSITTAAAITFTTSVTTAPSSTTPATAPPRQQHADSYLDQFRAAAQPARRGRLRSRSETREQVQVTDSDLNHDLDGMITGMSREQVSAAYKEEQEFERVGKARGYSSKAATTFQTPKPAKNGTFRDYLDEVELWLCAIRSDVAPSRRAILLLMELPTSHEHGGLRNIVRDRVGLPKL